MFVLARRRMLDIRKTRNRPHSSRYYINSRWTSPMLVFIALWCIPWWTSNPAATLNAWSLLGMLFLMMMMQTEIKQWGLSSPIVPAQIGQRRSVCVITLIILNQWEVQPQVDRCILPRAILEQKGKTSAWVPKSDGGTWLLIDKKDPWTNNLLVFRPGNDSSQRAINVRFFFQHLLFMSL